MNQYYSILIENSISKCYTGYQKTMREVCTLNAYGTLLKKLIRFTNIKLTNLAEIVGYDTSYISKWCNKGKLPAAKAAPNVNKCLADVFAREIVAQEDATLFAAEFNASGPYDESSISSTIFQLL